MIKDYDLCGQAPKDHSPSTVKLHKCSLTSVLVTLLNFLSDVQITLHSGLHEQYFMEFQLPARDTVGTVGRRGCLLIIFWWNLEPHLPWPLLHQIGGSAVFTVLWAPLSYRVARPGFSDSHDLPSHGVQFSTGLSRSVSGQRSSAAIYPAQCVNYRRTILVLPRHLAARGHCSTLLHTAPLSPCPMLQPFSLSSPDLYSAPGAGPADM